MRPVDSAADSSRVPSDSLAPSEPSEADRRPADGRDRPRAPDALSRRLDSLPDGHPSSPYEADGSPRQPIPRLRDLEIADENDDQPWEADPDQYADLDRTHPDDETDCAPDNQSDRGSLLENASPADRPAPLTDAQWTDHVTEVRQSLEKAAGAGLATDEQYTVDKARGIWSEARDLIHDVIIEQIFARSDDVPCDGKAIVAGGLGGAGKSTVLRNHAGIDLTQYLIINPDDIKEEMASLSLIPEVDGLTPMEASDLVHEESSHIAKRLARRAEAEGKNVIWDITMSSQKSAEDRIDSLRSAGYTVQGIFVDIPIETSVRRADARHREGHNDYLAGQGMGGRYVPAEVIEAQADVHWGSNNRKTFECVKHLFDHWSNYDNSVDGRRPVLTEAWPPALMDRERKAR